jgi:hypothetical protein
VKHSRPVHAKNGGVFHCRPDEWRHLKQQLAGEPGAAMSADVSGLRSARGVLRRLGSDLSFPEWYGGNFDALVDCLGDPELPAGRCPTLLLTGLGDLHRADRAGLDTFLAALRAAIEERQAQGRPLTVVVDIPLPGLEAFPGP